MTPTHWLYPISRTSHYALTDPVTGAETEVSHKALLAGIERNPKGIDKNGSSTQASGR